MSVFFSRFLLITILLTNIAVIKTSKAQLRRRKPGKEIFVIGEKTSGYDIAQRRAAEKKEKVFYIETVDKKTPLEKIKPYEEISVIEEKEKGYEIAQKLEEEKIGFCITKGDWKAFLGGSIRIEHFLYDRNALFNDKVPDQWGGFKQTTSILFNIIYGQKKYGHRAAEAFMDLRNKHKWGVVGVYKFTTPHELSIAGASIGEHTHRNARPTPWFKESWLNLSLNSIFKLDSKNLHFFKIGWFPFSLGRGIAFGDAYATVYEYLGLFSYFADASAPGILFHGDIVKDRLSYDLYYSKFEDNTIWITETFNTLKMYHIGRKYTPWSGVGKDDELWAARLKWKAIKSEKAGELEFEPYVYFNEASDQKVEFKKDVKTQLGAAGLSINYKNKNFEFGAEGAFNFGKEKLYAIDRNRIVYKKNDNGLLEQRYDHVVTQDPNVVPNPSAAVVTKDNATYVNNTAASLENKHEVMPGSGLYNAWNRKRPAYKNDLRGWMFVTDMCYTIDSWGLNIATEFGYFSGDEDPHYLSKNIDMQYDKNHEMFVGLHELYQGRKVLSAFFLGERELTFPLSLEKGEKEVDGYRAAWKSTALLNDLLYWGVGLTWEPKRFKSRSLELKPNLMFFWKDKKSYKYVLDPANPDLGHVSNTDKASNFLGTEFNIYFSVDLLKDLTLFGVLSWFFPGGFYKDIKGVPVGGYGGYLGDFYRDNFEGDPKANPLDYRLSDDMAMFTNITIKYVF